MTFNHVNAGSNPVADAKQRKLCFQYAVVAQSVEHLIGNEEVTGSNPVFSTKSIPHIIDV